MPKSSSGIIHIPILFILIALLIVGVIFQTATPTPTIEPTPDASITPSPTPTQPPTPRPTVNATARPSLIPTPAAVSGPPGSGYSNITVSTERGNFSISVVSIDMAGVRMITDTASDNDCANDCPVMPLADYVARNGGFAGINGTYFCPPDYAECASKKNSFDYPVFNTRLGKWINAGNLFWNDRSMMSYSGSMQFFRNANSGSSGSAAIVNTPGLLEGGNVIVDQFPLTSTQQAKGTRGGIGIRGNIVYLVIARNANMVDFAHIFKSLGATYALNLDGGGSTALWFGGYKAGPGRALPNAVIFTR